jgi:ribulose-bisphosphate carboxylase large chain
LHADLVLEAVQLPASLDSLLAGPRFGIEGLRAAVGAARRPLLCTALKPMGLSAAELAQRCFTFARAGIDVIKDDHGLCDHDFCPFQERVRACLEAVERAAERSGRRALYAPNLIGTPARIQEQAAFCRDLGVGAVVMTPMVHGLPTFFDLVQELGLPVLAHPAFAGAQRIAPPALLGTLFRAYGADAVIYPHNGGRFSLSEACCRELARRLREPDGPRRSALPVPAGGIRADRAGEVAAFYGRDVMLLIGGSLYLAGDELLERTRAFVAQVRGVGDNLPRRAD